MVLAQFGQGLAILGILYASSKLELGLMLVLAGICTAALSLNIFAVAQMFAGPRAAGTWCGIQNALGNLSGMLGPAVTGLIIDRAGYGDAFVFSAVIVAAGGLWWLVGVPPVRQVELD